MGLEGASWPGHSFLSHCCDFTFIIIIIIDIMPVISGRWEEDKYKAVCNRTATRPVHVLHVPSEGKIVSMCVLGGGGRVWMVSGYQGIDI